MFLEISQNSQEKPVPVSFLIKLQASGLLKNTGVSDTGLFMRILQTFQEHIFTEHLRASASVLLLSLLLLSFFFEICSKFIKMKARVTGSLKMI